MGEKTLIEWATHTLNPWWGCQRVSPGCQNCYAETLDKRVGGGVDPTDGVKKLRWGPTAPRIRTSLANWRKAFAWNAAAEKAGERHRVFCASMADVFEDRPLDREDLDAWRFDLFVLIRMTPHLDWLLLTKRPENVLQLLERCARRHGPRAGGGYTTSDTNWDETRLMLHQWINGKPPANVWVGTTVEDQQRANERIPELLKVPARVRFLSCEPLLEPVNLDRAVAVPGGEPCGLKCAKERGVGIDWIIIGGESGGKARPFNVEWARSLMRQGFSAGVSVFVKQLGANIRTRNDDMLTSDYEEDGWFLTGDGDVEEHLNGYREDFQGAEVRIRLKDSAGGDLNEWPFDLRVREFPR